MRKKLFLISEFVLRFSADDWATWYGYAEYICLYLYNL